MLRENDHDHGHSHDEPVVEPAIAEETGVVLESPIVDSHEGHSHDGLSGLWEVMFGFEHVIAEFFWNAVFILGTFLFTRAVALRKIHKYVDDKHDIKHDKY
jgi:hypothetical protein